MDLENQSLASLDKIHQKTDTVLSITLKEIDRRRHEGRLKREEKFLDHLANIKLLIMWSIGILLILFCLIILVAGLMPEKWASNSEGWESMQLLFIKITENAETIMLIILGFFFRDYFKDYVHVGKSNGDS